MTKALISKLEGLSDEELALLSQSGDKNAVKVIVLRYLDVVKIKAKKLVSRCILIEDLSQEGMFGLLSAIYNYKIDKSVKFKTYAEKCINNCMLSALKKYTRKKHIPLNSFISLEYGELEIPDAFNLEDIIISNEEVLKMMEVVERDLSLLEKSVITLYLDGKSYGEIALELGMSQKSVDNAMQRVFKKLRRSTE